MITTHGVVREKISKGAGYRFAVEIWAQNEDGEKKTVGLGGGGRDVRRTNPSEFVSGTDSLRPMTSIQVQQTRDFVESLNSEVRRPTGTWSTIGDVLGAGSAPSLRSW